MADKVHTIQQRALPLKTKDSRSLQILSAIKIQIENYIQKLMMLVHLNMRHLQYMCKISLRENVSIKNSVQLTFMTRCFYRSQWS